MSNSLLDMQRHISHLHTIVQKVEDICISITLVSTTTTMLFIELSTGQLVTPRQNAHGNVLKTAISWMESQFNESIYEKRPTT